MKLMDAIYTRHSVRSYAETPVERTAIEQLLQAAVQAPSAMNSQPWAFGVIQGAERLRDYSRRAKDHLLSMREQLPWLAGYLPILENPDYNLFYGAPALVVIYARPEGPAPQGDCCLAAENVMLAACDMGLGTCWIGFAGLYFNLDEVKQALGVPVDYTAIAPLIVGYPQGDIDAAEKKPPEMLFWI